MLLDLVILAGGMLLVAAGSRYLRRPNGVYGAVLLWLSGTGFSTWGALLCVRYLQAAAHFGS